MKKYEAVYQDKLSDSQIIIQDVSVSMDMFKLVAYQILEDMVQDAKEFTLIQVNKLYKEKQ